MDNLLAARALMGVSFVFHIIYATLGIGLPLLMMLAEGLALKTGDESWHRMARRWVLPAGVVFAIGAVSGTILSFELGLLWPRFMAFSGAMIGLAFSMEGFAFFTEAIFLSLYFYGERRLSRRVLFLCTIPLTLAAAISAIFVISANGWMNSPDGFRIVNGSPSDVLPLRAFANQAWPHEALHGTLAAYVATSFAVAGYYAASVLKGRNTAEAKNALVLSLSVAAVTAPLMLVTGDWAADSVAKFQKAKLAAMEAHFKTSAAAPLVIGGWPDPATGTVRYALRIPKLLSILAEDDPTAVVQGLDAFPQGTTPDPRLVHPFFDLMVGSFLVMAIGLGWFWWLRWRSKGVPDQPRLLKYLIFASPFGILALESGWLVTEFGRQPWAVQGYLRTSQAVTPNGGVVILFTTFGIVYICLTAGMLRLLLRHHGRPGAGGEGVGHV
ncbi:cytochrome ubiquinol oxidase subunit I [Geomonas nitrogeniifigens]|uniref:Cytochrome ubiquinol oxidase subunit I n=1 Tax=Geomonas diazotrophica TaxID=2843197 RepID=A0ABX8JQA4_9BACT|nr:cytochrome ubiquinol oxidase subunit I [Geomonas nitrogeniifigens]QWV99251.1 cytochrome ubiquinol oxidase subunit I [Geomonas nitrogeniifigens]